MADNAELIAFVAQATGKARLRLSGRSMRPLLRAGVIVDIEPLASGVRRGEILVYRTPRGLVAHRLLRQLPKGYLTCGDAQPERLEIVPADAVLGRVHAVWSSDAADARRVDGPFFQLAGMLLVATRPLRAPYVFAAARAATLFAEPCRTGATPFRALVAASLAFEAGVYTDGVAALASLPPADVVDIVKRHHASGLVARWLDRAVASGAAVPGELHDAFRRVRLSNALQAGRVLTRVRDVAQRLAEAGVDAIFLKGGGRLAADERDADLQFSGDVDVLVPAHAAERAVAVLRAAGYKEKYGARRVAFFAQFMHQRAPLFAADNNVPVEVHVALLAPGKATASLSYAELEPFARAVSGPAGDVRVLDDVTAAVHLAYHGHDFRVWRDIVLLSRKLRAFSLTERARFEAWIAREKRNAVRLRAAVAVADALAQRPMRLAGALETYVTWAVAREDMPLLLRRRAHVVEAVVAHCRAPYQGLWQTRVQLRGWFYNALLTPAVVRALRADIRLRAPGSALFDTHAERGRPNAASAVAASTQTNAAP